jgi:hypothetical protein
MPASMNAATRKNATTHTCGLEFTVQDINISFPFFKSSFIYIFSLWQNSRTPSRIISLVLSLTSAFAKFRKTTISFVVCVRQSVCLSVCPYGITRQPLDGLLWNFILEYFANNSANCEIKARVISGNRCYCSCGALMKSRTLNRSLKLKICKILIRPAVT